MKIKTSFLAIIAIIIIIATTTNASAQQYRLRQVTHVMNMKSETTIYVKGMRKRTEGGGYTGMQNNLVTIEQCDLQRTITINDKKRLYHIEPFSKPTENIVYEDEKPSPKTNPIAVNAASEKGGVVTMYYNITDTGERKKMYGMTARHVWTTQKITPSPNACMKDSMIIKTDGWYIDLPQFNCPIQYTPTTAGGPGVKPDCKDRYVTRQSGKGKLGFPLIEKRTMIMGNGLASTSTFETNLETLEFSTAKPDSLLFEIPVGYTLTKNMDDLYEKMDAASIMAQSHRNNEENNAAFNAEPKKTGLRIAVLEPSSVEGVSATELQQYLVNKLSGYNIQAIPVSSLEKAKEANCSLVLSSKITQLKQASKVGGFLKAIRNADPSAVSSYNVDAQFSLSRIQDGSIQSEKNVSGKFEGTTNSAAKKALDEGSRLLAQDLH